MLTQDGDTKKILVDGEHVDQEAAEKAAKPKGRPKGRPKAKAETEK